jgi:hypothetical protein
MMSLNPISPPALAAMARASRALARPGLAELIEADRLPPAGVFVALAMSLHPAAARHAVTISMAAALAVWDSDPVFADRTAELCRRLVGGGELFRDLVEQARAFV